MRLLRTESSMMMAMWLLGLVSATSGQAPTPPMGSFDVVSFGAKADGKTDDTAAIQKALDATSKLGGVVRLMAGKFLVAGSLEIPVGVVVAGSTPIRPQSINLWRFFTARMALARSISEITC